jgi:serine/threonine protein kinase
VSLNHANIVRVFGGSLSPRPFIVMEYCELGSLDRIISETKRYNIENAHRLTWSKHLASGLAFLHLKRVLHRDVKSMNVLVDNMCRAKLSDLGLASHHTSSSSFRRTQNSLEGGTINWISPEGLKKRSYNVACDMWGYGLIVYHIIEGKQPFAEEPDISAAINKINLDRTKMNSSGTPKVLRDVFKNCVQVDARKRPCAAAVLEFIEAAEERESKTTLSDNELMNMLLDEE